MRRELVLAMMILAASSLVAVAVNMLRATALPWIRESRPVPEPTRPPSPTPAPGQPAVAGALPPVVPSPPGETITTDQVLKFLASGTVHFVDAREDHEWVEGRLRGAIHLPSSAIYKYIERVTAAVPRNEKVIVYCTGGDCDASHKVADVLQRDFHFTDVHIFEMGWVDIEKSGRFGEYIVKRGPP